MTPATPTDRILCTCDFSHQREMQRNCTKCGGYIADDAPSARDMFDTMLALRRAQITPDEFRAVMRRSRTLNGEAEHERRKVIALANFDRA